MFVAERPGGWPRSNEAEMRDILNALAARAQGRLGEPRPSHEA